jgi:hypothetical protein
MIQPRPPTFGSLNYVCRNIDPPKPRVVPDTFDYTALLGAMRDEWELAGAIAERIDLRAQRIGRRLAKLWNNGQGPIIRYVLRTEIYWRLA